MLKKMFSPKVHDICPNCGEACATTDVLCPKCGKNLDELFEQLPDAPFTDSLSWIAHTLNNPQILKVWNVTNAIILVISLITPWVVFFSDNVFIKFDYQYELGFKFLLYPLFVLSTLFQSTFYGGEFAFFLGLSFVEAAAPAIAIYYSCHGIRSFFNIERRINPTNSILRLILATLSLVLINYSTGFNSYLSFGYILVTIGLLSSFILEFIPVFRGHKPIPKEAANQ